MYKIMETKNKMEEEVDFKTPWVTPEVIEIGLLKTKDTTGGGSDGISYGGTT